MRPTLSKQQQNHKRNMRQSKFIPPPSPSPPLISPAKHLQNRLKKEISIKFTKQLRKDEANRSSEASQRRHHSLLLSNPLTKSSFSLTDATTHKATARDFLQPVKTAVKPMSSKKILALSFRQCHSSLDHGFFKTGAEVADVPIQALTHHPSLTQLKRGVSQVTMQERSNKFRLLFKEKSTQYKSASERKISRIDSKIAALRQKRLYLESLIPQQQIKPQIVRSQPKRYPISQEQFKEKIVKMVNQLIRTVELYFNMYLHDNIVGGHLKKVEGYNRKISSILMLDETRAKRFKNIQQVTTLFQVFGDSKHRNDYFMQEDMGLFNSLSNFLLKLDKKYGEMLEGYKYYEHKRRKDENEAFRKTREKFQRRMGKNDQINSINNFIQNRLYLDQTRRQDYMQNLQKRGVVLNMIQRSRQLILRQKQNAAKQALS